MGHFYQTHHYENRIILGINSNTGHVIVDIPENGCYLEFGDSDEKSFRGDFLGNPPVCKQKSISDIWENLPNFSNYSDWELDFILGHPHQSESSQMCDYLANLETSEKKPHPSHKITANIATQKSRLLLLLDTLESIRGQFDEVRIYLNDYDSIPPELEEWTCQLGPDLTDNGKFFWSQNLNEYYFTLDDDIIYPPDYVQRTLPKIKNRIVTYHGRNLTKIGQPYYGGHKVYTFYQQTSHEIRLDVGGTGVMAFDTNQFQPTFWKSPAKKMTDLTISLEASIWNVEIFLLTKEYHWIKPNSRGCSGIYHEFLNKDTLQTRFADMILINKDSQNRLAKNPLITSIGSQGCELIREKISLLLKNSGLWTFYHLGCFGGNFIKHLSQISDFREFIAIDSVSERIEWSRLNFSDNDENSQRSIKFICAEFWQIEFCQNSVVLINDYNISPERTQEIWNKLPRNSHFISTKIIDSIPQLGFRTTSTDGTKLMHYYYIKQ